MLKQATTKRVILFLNFISVQNSWNMIFTERKTTYQFQYLLAYPKFSLDLSGRQTTPTYFAEISWLLTVSYLSTYNFTELILKQLNDMWSIRSSKFRRDRASKKELAQLRQLSSLRDIFRSYFTTRCTLNVHQCFMLTLKQWKFFVSIISREVLDRQ